MNTPASLLPDSIRTDRLLLRRWRDEDLVPFAELNSDPDVMTYMPALLDRHRCPRATRSSATSSTA